MITRSCFAITLLLLFGGVQCPADQQTCIVATVQPLATDAGLDAFQAGGNAVDAAVAAALTLGVADGHNSGIGGGCFILILKPDGSLIAIDGRETAPAAATADMFVRDGKAQAELSTVGSLAIGVPGALAAYQLAIKKSGALQLADLLEPAAELAERGVAIDRIYAANLSSKAKQLADFEGSRAVLLNADGQPYREGEIIRQPDLANTYRAVAKEGIEWFYDGPFAQKIQQWMDDNGGLITAADFASYRPIEREPIVTGYRDWKVIGFPPPSSGGVHVAQMLNILETFDLAAIHQENPDEARHVMIEAMKLAFADRAHWLGDADFAKVPKGLVDKTYAASLASKIDRRQASEVPSHGDPLTIREGYFGRHTTHIAAADSQGYWVAITATVNTSFGSKVIVPETGVILNNEMDDFSSQPGVPNAFGLIGAENNAIAPGKRPLSSMSPTIILNAQDEPVMTVGAAGGPKIITQVLLAIVRHLDFQQTLTDAISSPRFHHQWRPDQVLVERTNDDRVVGAIKRYGHAVSMGKSAGVSQAIGLDQMGMIGVSDPRVPGKVGVVSR